MEENKWLVLSSVVLGMDPRAPLRHGVLSKQGNPIPMAMS